MKKLLRFSKFLHKDGDRCLYADKCQPLMAEHYFGYFETAVPGQVLNWSGGTLVMGDDRVAVYTDAGGVKHSLTKESSLFKLYNDNPGIRKSLDETYGSPSGKECCPFAGTSLVFIGQHVEDTDAKILIPNSEYTETLCQSNYLLQTHVQINELIAKEIAAQFPERKNHKLSYLDACLLEGDAPGHPAGTHPPACNVFDLHYYTLGDCNRTQRGGPDCGPINIWADEAHTQLNEMWDAERNLCLVLLLIDAYPQLTDISGDIYQQLCVNTAIKKSLISEAQKIPFNSFGGGDPIWKVVDRVVCADENSTFKHWLHMHCYVGSDINRGMTL